LSGRVVAALALESAISAELVLFAVFLLARRQGRTAALYFLSALALILTVLMAANLAIAIWRWDGLTGWILFFDLLVPPVSYLYVRHIRSPEPALRPIDLAHALPAFAGVVLWVAGIVGDMDAYVNLVWFGYLVATGALIARHYRGYAPAQRQRFVIVLLGALTAIAVLRLWIVMGAGSYPFREGLPFLLILGSAFFATFHILYTALAYPDLLSVPGSHIKYAQSGLSDAKLDEIESRASALLAETRPYLDPEFAMAQLAEALGIPARLLSQAINSRHGVNVAAYINRQRAQSAAEILLSEPDVPIKIVVHRAGFKSKSVFNREFQRCFSASPSDYRRTQNDESST